MSDTSSPNNPVLPPDTNLDGVAIGPTWQEQDGLLRDLWMDNQPPQVIADKLSRSISAIMTRAARLGLPRRAAPGRKPRPTIGQNGDIAISTPRENRRALPKATTGQESLSDQAQQSAPRVCLMCLRTFQSVGRHNRICSSCKGSADYMSASALADIHLPQT